MISLKTYHRKSYTAKGIVTTTAIGLIATAGMLYGAQSCDKAVDAVTKETRTPYELVIEDYAKLDEAQRAQFLNYAWDSATNEQKASIVGDDLGIKVSDIYINGLEETLSR